MERGYWGSAHTSGKSVTKLLGLSGSSYFSRIIGGTTGVQGWTVNRFIPYLGFGARSVFRLPFVTSPPDQREFRLNVAPYQDARIWYGGWADVARAIDWTCGECLGANERDVICMTLIFVDRIEHPDSRDQFDELLALIPHCAHRAKKDAPQLYPEMAQLREAKKHGEDLAPTLRWATMQSMLRYLRNTEVLLGSGSIQDFAKALGVDPEDYSLYERAVRDFPEWLQNRLVAKLDPVYHVIFEAVDGFERDGTNRPVPTVTPDGAPLWYRSITRQLHALYETDHQAQRGLTTEAYASLLQSLRIQIHSPVSMSALTHHARYNTSDRPATEPVVALPPYESRIPPALDLNRMRSDDAPL